MEHTEALTLQSLVTLQSDVEPYLLDWPTVGAIGLSETLALVVMVRPGGFLVAVPVGFIPASVLDVGNAPSPPGPVGPSTVLSVPGAVLDNGTLSPTGSSLSVVVVDFAESLLSQLHPLPAFSEVQFAFDPEQPYAVPSPLVLVARVKEWLEAGGESGPMGYVTAVTDVEDIDGVELEEGDLPEMEGPPEASTPPRTPKEKKPSRRTVPGPGRPSTGEKRHTVASLASSLHELIQVNTGLSQQVQNLTLRQQDLEKRTIAPSQALVPPMHSCAGPSHRCWTISQQSPQPLPRRLVLPREQLCL